MDIGGMSAIRQLLISELAKYFEPRGFNKQLYICCPLSRTFANETTQFLAPYQVSQQKNSQCFDADFDTTPSADATTIASAHCSPPPLSAALPAASMSSIEQSMHTRSAERCEPDTRKKLGKWNPFEDPTPFSQMTEDHIFDAEFDAIRQRGSQNSKFPCYGRQ